MTLHDKLRNAQTHNETILKQQLTKIEDLKSKYQKCFDTDEGSEIIDDLVETYLTRSPTGQMSPNEIMFLEGQNSVVRRILTLLNKK